MSSLDALRDEILTLVTRYGEQASAVRPFVPGQTPIPASGKVVGAMVSRTATNDGSLAACSASVITSK